MEIQNSGLKRKLYGDVEYQVTFVFRGGDTLPPIPMEGKDLFEVRDKWIDAKSLDYAGYIEISYIDDEERESVYLLIDLKEVTIIRMSRPMLDAAPDEDNPRGEPT